MYSILRDIAHDKQGGEMGTHALADVDRRPSDQGSGEQMDIRMTHTAVSFTMQPSENMTYKNTHLIMD